METLPALQSTAIMPVMSLSDAAQRRTAIVEFTKSIMVKDVDYGVIPGTGNKPTLLKPGAEKLSTFFGLSPRYELIDRHLDWSGADHNGEPFFYLQYKCQLFYGDRLAGEGIGSCNSWEKKYRYRKGDRVCPECGHPAIIKGRKEYGGGWICFGKKGGCGSKWSDDDSPFDTQDPGQVLNDNPADLVNTIDKMGQKRALVAATLIAVNASEFFTQDVEDMDFSHVITVDAIDLSVTPKKNLGYARKIAEVQEVDGQPTVVRLPEPKTQPVPGYGPGYQKGETRYVDEEDEKRAEAIAANPDIPTFQLAEDEDEDDEPASPDQIQDVADELNNQGVLLGDEMDLIHKVYQVPMSKWEAANNVSELKAARKLTYMWLRVYVAMLATRANVDFGTVKQYLLDNFKALKVEVLTKKQQQQLINWLAVSVDEDDEEDEINDWPHLLAHVCERTGHDAADVEAWLFATFGDNARDIADLDPQVFDVVKSSDIDMMTQDISAFITQTQDIGA